ncbi:hypothetical protein [Winslowiella iniecta]|uniref:hypothetical protein n=1 Tax=Winslowiella iniecta TaxID=1560201 RepID=UPI000AF163E2|nr:hypothetical protein [Winslowiella iniecta]
MMEQTRSCNAHQMSKMKSGYCKTRKHADELTIPTSWNLSELQRDFIESLFDNNKK